jgi:ketosteroid isomerase-like protein
VEPPSALLGAGMPPSYEGHRGLRELAADWREAWERMDVSPAEVLDAGDRVAVLGHSRVRARASGVELDSPLASVFWFERGLIVRHRDFTDWEEALDAAGISPARRAGV